MRAEALAVLTDLGLVPDVTDTPVDAAEANTAAALDEAAAKITALQRALDRVTAVNDRLAEDASATKAQRDAAREQLNIARTSLREERDTHATRVAELNRLRQDPDRIARAAAGAQYEWVLRGLHQATTALATVDNRLDTEQSVLTGEYQEAVLRTVDALSMRLTAIRSKLGGEWTTGPL